MCRAPDERGSRESVRSYTARVAGVLRLPLPPPVVAHGLGALQKQGPPSFQTSSAGREGCFVVLSARPGKGFILGLHVDEGEGLRGPWLAQTWEAAHPAAAVATRRS